MILLFVISIILFLLTLLIYSPSAEAGEATDNEINSQSNSAEGSFEELPSTSRLVGLQDSLDVVLGSAGNLQQNRSNNQRFSSQQYDLFMTDLGNEEELSPTLQSASTPHCNLLTDSLDDLLAASPSAGARERRVPEIDLSSIATAWPADAENAPTPRRYPYGRATWIVVLNQILSNAPLSSAAGSTPDSNSQSFANAQNDIFEPRPDRRFRHPRIDYSDPLFSYPLSEDPDAKKVRERRERKRKIQEASLELSLDEEENEAAVIPQPSIEAEEISLPSLDSTELPIWLKTQLYLQNRALAYQEQQYHHVVNLKEDLDLWSILIHRGICKKNEHTKTLDWVKEQTLVNGSGLEGVIGQFNAQLLEYETCLQPFQSFLINDEAYGNFMAFYLTLPNDQDQELREEKLQKWFEKMQKILMKMPVSRRIASNISNETLKQSLHRKWLSADHKAWTVIGLPSAEELQLKSYVHKAVAQAMHLEVQRYKFIQLQARLEEFYKEQLAALPPITAESVIDFSVRLIDVSDVLLAKFMEGKHEKSNGIVEEHPISTDEVNAMIAFIQTHRDHAAQYIRDCLL